MLLLYYPKFENVKLTKFCPETLFVDIHIFENKFCQNARVIHRLMSSKQDYGEQHVTWCNCYHIFVHQIPLFKKRRDLFDLLVKLPPVYCTQWRLRIQSLFTNVKQVELWLPILIVLYLIRLEVEREFFDPVANTLFTRLLRRNDEKNFGASFDKKISPSQASGPTNKKDKFSYLNWNCKTDICETSLFWKFGSNQGGCLSALQWISAHSHRSGEIEQSAKPSKNIDK